MDKVTWQLNVTQRIYQLLHLPGSWPLRNQRGGRIPTMALRWFAWTSLQISRWSLCCDGSCSSWRCCVAAAVTAVRNFLRLCALLATFANLCTYTAIVCKFRNGRCEIRISLNVSNHLSCLMNISLNVHARLFIQKIHPVLTQSRFRYDVTSRRPVQNFANKIQIIVGSDVISQGNEKMKRNGPKRKVDEERRILP